MPNLPSKATWKRAWGNLKAFQERHPRFKVTAVGIVVLIVQEVFLGLLLKTLQFLGGLVRALGQRPLSEGGAVLLLALIVSMVWVAIDPIRLRRERKALRLAQEAAAAAAAAPPPESPEPPPPPPLSVQEENLVHFARLFWTDTLGQAVHRLVLITQKLQETLRPTDPLVELISPPVWDLEASRQRLWDLFEVRQTPPDIIMSALRHITERYMRVVQWVNYYRDACALDFEQPPFLDPESGEANWRTFHERFKNDFEVLCERPGFASLNHYREHKMLSDRRESPPTGLGERGRAMDLLLRQLSEPETQFLSLLASHAASYDQPGPPVLPNAVFQAGEGLARKGVFVTREISDDTRLFTVPDHIVPFLKRHIFPQSEMNREIRLNLHRVFGSGGSGSGIPIGGSIPRYQATGAVKV